MSLSITFSLAFSIKICTTANEFNKYVEQAELHPIQILPVAYVTVEPGEAPPTADTVSVTTQEAHRQVISVPIWYGQSMELYAPDSLQ